MATYPNPHPPVNNIYLLASGQTTCIKAFLTTVYFVGLTKILNLWLYKVVPTLTCTEAWETLFVGRDEDEVAWTSVSTYSSIVTRFRASPRLRNLTIQGFRTWNTFPNPSETPPKAIWNTSGTLYPTPAKHLRILTKPTSTSSRIYPRKKCCSLATHTKKGRIWCCFSALVSFLILLMPSHRQSLRQRWDVWSSSWCTP